MYEEVWLKLATCSMNVKILTLFRMGLFGANPPPSPPLREICHTYAALMKLGTVIPYLKKIHKMYESRETPFEFCWHQRFFKGNQLILLYQEIKIYFAFWYIISNSFNFFESLKIVLIIMVIILMISAKLATRGLLKMKVFRNEGYDVIIYVHDVNNKLYYVTQIIL